MVSSSTFSPSKLAISLAVALVVTGCSNRDSSQVKSTKANLGYFVDSVLSAEPWGEGLLPWHLYVRDLNGDNHSDVLLGTTSPQGSDFTYIPYVYDATHRHFQKVEQLIGLPNLAFRTRDSTVTSWWLNASTSNGWAYKLRWRGLRLDTLDYLELDYSLQKDSAIRSRFYRQDYQLFDEGP